MKRLKPNLYPIKSWNEIRTFYHDLIVKDNFELEPMLNLVDYIILLVQK